MQAGRSKALARWVLLQSLSCAQRPCPSAAIAISHNADVVKGAGFPTTDPRLEEFEEAVVTHLRHETDQWIVQHAGVP